MSPSAPTTQGICHLIERLPCISPIETFGCELTLLNADAQVALQDPVQEELWNTNHFSLIVHECFRHALLDAGFTAMGPQEWRHWHSLRIDVGLRSLPRLLPCRWQKCRNVEFGVPVFAELCAGERGQYC